jgi:hypothetical protein
LLDDNTEYLKSVGLQMTSIPERSNDFLTEEQFEEATASDQVDNLDLAKSVFLSIDGFRSVEGPHLWLDRHYGRYALNTLGAAPKVFAVRHTATHADQSRFHSVGDRTRPS